MATKDEEMVRSNIMTKHHSINCTQRTTPSLPYNTSGKMSPGNLEERSRVLVVEDEEAIRSLLSCILALKGYRVTCASNGRTALSKIEDVHYDAIICGVRMPVMNGIMFYEELARIHPDQAMRVIFCACLVISDLQPLLLETGRDALLKPFLMAEVYDAVRVVVQHSTSRDN